MMLNRLIAFSLQRRAFVIAIAVLVCAYGLYAALELPVDVLPDLNRPTVAVMTEAPGLPPEDIEAQITTPLEAALSGSAGSATIRSVSSSGFSLINIEFQWGSDVYRNRQVVQERLDQLAARLPGNARPVMLADASLMGEIMLIGVVPGGSDDAQLTQLRTFADWTLRPKLLALPGVAQISVIGGRKPQWQVLADPQAMREHGVTFSELKEALQQATARSSVGGAVVESERETAVAVSGVASMDALAGALIKNTDGVPITVGDVATLRAGTQLPRGDASLNGKPALIVAVQKQAKADTRAVTAEVDRALDELRASLPGGFTLEPNLFRQADFIRSSVGNVSESLAGGAVLAASILVLFLLRFRPVLVTLIAMPVSLLATAAVFKLFGQSINCMTLGGIAIAIGELADDAIVDVENIQRRIAEAHTRVHPSGLLAHIFSASMEIRSAIVYGTALVLLALLPLLFLPGLDGRLFAPLASAYIVSIFMSMLVALTLTPALASLLLGRSAPQGEALILRGFKRAARWLYALCIPRPITVLGVLAVALLLAGITAERLGRDYLPPFSESTLTIQLRAWPEISLTESNRLATKVEEMLLGIPEVRTTGRRTARAELDEHAEGLHSSELDVTFWGNAESPPVLGRSRPAVLRSGDIVLREIEEKLRGVPVLAVSVSKPITHRIDHLLSGVKSPVVIKLRGGDVETLRRLAARVETSVRSVPGVTHVINDRPMPVPRLQPRLNREALAQYGFTANGVAEMLGTALNGQLIAPALSARQPSDVLLWSAENVRQSPERLREMPLVSPSGAFVRLADVADVIETDGPSEIRHEGGARQITIACSVAGRDLGGAVNAMKQAVEQNVTPSLPSGYSVQFSGEYEARGQATRFLLPAAMLALCIAVLLLFAHFRALAPVLLVLINIPFAFIGGVLALALAHETLSLASVIGFVTLAGIAGRNGVLLISHYYHLIGREGLPLSRSTIERGSQERVAPVLMTALTTGLALIPLIISRGQPGREILHPMALVVVGGLLTTTLLDFAATPALFLRFCRVIPEMADERELSAIKK